MATQLEDMTVGQRVRILLKPGQTWGKEHSHYGTVKNVSRNWVLVQFDGGMHYVNVKREHLATL